jgi:hypothetical protein
MDERRRGTRGTAGSGARLGRGVTDPISVDAVSKATAATTTNAISRQGNRRRVLKIARSVTRELSAAPVQRG